VWQKRTTKKLLQQLQPHLPQLSNLELDDGDDNTYDEIDFQVAFPRPRIVENNTAENEDDAELSDYVTVRLAVARAKAMAKYRKLHA
jgi:hypothetical protein